MKFSCPACGDRSINVLVVYLHFGVIECRENRFRCSSCNRPLKSFFSLPTIFMCGVLLQAVAAILSGRLHAGSVAGVAFNSWLLTVIALFLYPIFVAEQEEGLARGGRRFLRLCMSVLVLALLLRFF